MTIVERSGVSTSASFPDAQTIRTALTLATRAPSVHNTQPWRWKVGQHSIHLFADPARHLVHTDPDRRELMVSCGMVLHHAATALAALGWRARVNRFPNPQEPLHLAAIALSPARVDNHDVALAAAIPCRRTDRRRFSSWPVPRADIATIGARVARMGIQLRHVEMSLDIKSIVAAGVLSHPENASPGDDHAVLVALGSAADDDLARLRAGEAGSVALLTATSFGLGSCPVTEPLEIGDTRDAIRSEVFDDREYPQMMLRIGWAPVGADALPATPRRPIDEVVTTLDGAPLH